MGMKSGRRDLSIAHDVHLLLAVTPSAMLTVDEIGLESFCNTFLAETQELQHQRCNLSTYKIVP